MADRRARAAIPSVALPLVGGGATNLADFCGQKLVVFFCGAGEVGAEIAAYAALADQFEDVGAWIVGVVEGPLPPRSGVSTRLELGIDSDGSAFERLATCAPAEFAPSPERSATFLIDRDRTVRHAWAGSGHAGDALSGARERP